MLRFGRGLGGGRGWLRVGLGVVCANPVVGFVYPLGQTYICVWLVLGLVDTGLGRGSPWVPPLR